jgi:ferredoxin--NADP+ reductase
MRSKSLSELTIAKEIWKQDMEEEILKGTYKVQNIRKLTDSVYVLRFNRNGMEFKPGQHLTISLPGSDLIREYSIYSNVNEPFLEVLIREVEQGSLSRTLKQLKEGDIVNVEGPYGYFTLNEKTVISAKHLFIASGTGISPFHSIIGTYPAINYQLLHGVRFSDEAYDHNFYKPDRYHLCTSRDNIGFNGRVTDYLKINPPEADEKIYICGNYNMINDVYNLLTAQGINYNQIRAEVYF